jgi:spore coat protein U-like protein
LGEVDSTGLNGVAGTNGTNGTNGTDSVNCANKSPCAIGLLHSDGAPGGTDSVAALTMSHSHTVSYALFSNVGLTTAGKPVTSDQFPPG